MVMLARNERLAIELERRMAARRKVVSSFYQDTKADIDPVHWQHLPENSDIQEAPFFADYIRADPEPCGQQHVPVDAGRSALLGFVDKWIRERQAHLREIMQQDLPTVTRVSQPEQGGVLDLATAVFLCGVDEFSPCPALIGWDAVGPHLFCDKRPWYRDRATAKKNKHSFRFCVRGYHTVIQILGLLNLDPLVTTAQELDKLNARFICNNSMTNAPVMTWRECVWFAPLYYANGNISNFLLSLNAR